MKIIGIIPARYKSSRFPGKPLADICGKPMIWWVYQQAKKVKEFSDVYVATDDKRICDELDQYNIPYIMTYNDHPNHINRIHEVSDNISADYYVCINGDEPLVDPVSIETAIKGALSHSKKGFYGAFRYLTDPAETVDPAKIKIVLNERGQAIYISRSVVPYPKNDLMFRYKKYVGIEVFSKASLDFFVSKPMGRIEKIEDIDHLRFLENGYPAFFTEVQSESISVDTPKDLEKVQKIIQRKIELKEVVL